MSIMGRGRVIREQNGRALSDGQLRFVHWE
jgi:hypothetical protein